MKPYFNDDFSKSLVEQVAYSMNEAEKKCAGTGAGTMCPVHGDADCNSSKQNRKEEIEILVDGEEYLFEKMDGKDDNGFKSCWKGYKKVGTKMKGGKEVNDCVKAGYEMIGELELDEKAPPGAKFERMVKHIKKSYSKDGELTKKEKGIAYATAWKQKNKMKEAWEGSKEDKDEDKKLAKKHKMSLKDWEKSAADKKHDMKKEEVEKAEKEKDEGGKHKEYKHAKGKEEKGEKKTEKEMKEELKGGQKKIDANHNNKIDSGDFAILRNKRAKKTVKEMWQLAAEAKAQIDVMPEIDDEDPNNITKKKKKEKIEKDDK